LYRISRVNRAVLSNITLNGEKISNHRFNFEQKKSTTFLLCLDYAWFTLSRNVEGQNNRCWCYYNPHAIFVIFLYISLKYSDWALNHGARDFFGGGGAGKFWPLRPINLHIVILETDTIESMWIHALCKN